LSVVAHGEQAVQKTESMNPDIILMDIILKGPMDGIETARTIKKKSNVPIIFLTAHADQTTRNRANTVNPQGYLLKPFQEKELNQVILDAFQKVRLQYNSYSC
jgi:two-component system, response regulator PdtaR